MALHAPTLLTVLAVLAVLTAVLAPRSVDGFIITDEETVYTLQPKNEFVWAQFSAVPPRFGTGLTLQVEAVTAAAACTTPPSGVSGKAAFVDGALPCEPDTAAEILQRAGVGAVMFTRATRASLSADLQMRAPAAKATLSAFTIPVLLLNNGTHIGDRLTKLEVFSVKLFQEPMAPAHTDALVELYYETNGGAWGFSNSINGVAWNVFGWDADPCRDNWERVICTPDGNVNQLLLDQMGLIGELPPELRNISSITRFNIQDNKVYGNIPDIGTWSELKVFNVASNSLGGQGLPAFFGALEDIILVDLSSNLFSGTFDQFQTPASLEILRLSSNSITGSLPTVYPSINLVELDLANNGLEGTIPAAFITLLPSLTLLDLSRNKLTGAAPASLASLSKIEILNLGGNSLTSLPALTGITTLEELYLQGNALASVPDLSSNTGLRVLDISSNGLTGAVFASFASSVETFVVDSNAYTSIPSALRTSNVRFFSATDNRFGDLVTTLGSIPARVQTLDLSSCGLTHSYPQLSLGEFSQLGNVEEIVLSNNNIKSHLVSDASDMIEMSSLRKLDLSNNKLLGMLSDNLGNLPALEYLDVSGNSDMVRQAGPGPLVPTFAHPVYTSVDTSAMDNAACPTFYNPTSKLRVVMDHSYHSYRLCTCLDNYYNTTEGACLPCLSNAVCIGYPTNTTHSTMVPLKGYFPLTVEVTTPSIYAATTSRTNTSAEASARNARRRRRPRVRAGRSLLQFVAQELAQTTVTATVPRVMSPCEFSGLRVTSDDNPCNPDGSNSTFYCRTGSGGRLCSQCVDGYFRQDGRCIECSDSAGLWPIVMILMSLLLLGGVVAVVLTRDTIPRVERVYRPMIVRNAHTAVVTDDEDPYTLDYAYDTGDSVSDNDDDDVSESEEQERHAHAGLQSSPLAAREAIIARKKKRALRLFLQSAAQVTVNWAQSVSILMSDLSLPESVLPLLSTVSVVRATTSDSGIGFECIDGLESFHAQYRLMMLIPTCVIVCLLVAFSIKFAMRYKTKKAIHDAQDTHFDANAFAVDDLNDGLGSGRSTWTASSQSTSLSTSLGSSSSTSLGSSSSTSQGSSLSTSQGSSVSSYTGAPSVSSGTSGSEEQEAAEPGEQDGELVAHLPKVVDARGVVPPTSPLRLLTGHWLYLSLAALNFFFFPTSAYILNVYQCDADPVSKIEYLSNYPHLKCTELAVAERVVPLLVYIVAPIMILVTAMVAIERKHRSYMLNTSLGFWFDPFRARDRYFALVFLLRRLALAVLASFFPNTQIERHILVFCILLASALVVYARRPFYWKSINVLDVVCHASLIIIYAAGILVGESTNSTRRAVATGTFVLCFSGALLTALFLVVRAMYRVYRKGEWHDQTYRDSQAARLKKLYALYQIGIHPVAGDRLVD